MSTMKSKLAASVRQVKAQAPAAPTPAKKSPAKAAAVKAAPAPAPSATGAVIPARASAVAGEPPASGHTLFPNRVWPD